MSASGKPTVTNAGIRNKRYTRETTEILREKKIKKALMTSSQFLFFYQVQFLPQTFFLPCEHIEKDMCGDLPSFHKKLTKITSHTTQEDVAYEAKTGRLQEP